MSEILSDRCLVRMETVYLASRTALPIHAGAGNPTVGICRALVGTQMLSLHFLAGMIHQHSTNCLQYSPSCRIGL